MGRGAEGDGLTIAMHCGFLRRLAARPALRSLAGACVMLLLVTACTWVGSVRTSETAATEPGAPRWFKGNLHTHSLWSDGDEYPEVIADWYKKHGYHFLAISDHNVLHVGERWFVPKTEPVESGYGRGGGGEVLERYRNRFGPGWVDMRESNGVTEVRLKTLEEYRVLLEEPGRFLLIPGEEISASWGGGHPVHLNATNVAELIKPRSAATAVEAMQLNIDAVLEQRARTGCAILPHINHPNFKWAITAEDLMQVRGARFFEVYNGHSRVHNEGDAAHLGMDEMWDAVLTRRLAELHLGVMFAVATDDSHNYQQTGPGFHNSGRGWVMVRAPDLSAGSIIRAMEEGDFYASTGVTLRDVRREGGRLSLEIDAEPGVSYVIRFIGTRRGYDPSTEELPQPPLEPGELPTLPHRRYSEDVGAILAEVNGTGATYTLKGDELYVRAKIISSKPKANGSVTGEFETAWTQPLVNPDPGGD